MLVLHVEQISSLVLLALSQHHSHIQRKLVQLVQVYSVSVGLVPRYKAPAVSRAYWKGARPLGVL